MTTGRPTFRRDLSYVASAAIAALILVEVEAASRATFDAVQSSTAIAFRVVSSHGHVRLTAGLSLSLTATAVCLILLARIGGERLAAVDPHISLADIRQLDGTAIWRNRLIRAARLGGALDR
jgi:hypothetical protein